MSKVRQNFAKDSEERENKRWNHKFINSEGVVYKTFINALIGKLKSKRIIVMICLASVTFMIIPVIPILLAFLAGRWLHFTRKKSF
jgi:hypothetical protein